MEITNFELVGLPGQETSRHSRVVTVKPIIPVDASEFVDVGTKCATKNLYEGPVKRPGDSNWVEKYPDDLGVVAESAETAQYALLVRHRRNKDNSKRLLVIDSLVIQSPFLKLALAPVLRNYPGITTELERLTFNAPFHPLIHRWGELEKAMKDENNPVAKQHLDLFYRTLHDEIKDTIAEIKDVVSLNVITFNLLWAIFRPGDLIFTVRNGKEACFELKSGNYVIVRNRRVFSLQIEHLDWSGTAFGRSATAEIIDCFEGTKPITQLTFFPLAYHPDREAIRERLINRGKIFEELKGYHYKSYAGLAIGSEVRGGSRKFDATGRVIIDAQAYHRFSGVQKPNLTVPNQGPQDPRVLARMTNQRVGANVPLGSHQVSVFRHGRPFLPQQNADPSFQGQVNVGAVNPATVADDEAIDENIEPLTDEQLVLASHTVKGYSMKAKRWASFFIDSFSEIVWSGNAFDKLVLPGAHKELVLAFAEGQLKYEKRFDDIIQGKGKGIILLLSGPPGVGKTLTAESVSETMRTPLFAMSAGDLGLNPESLETELSKILEMVTKWNAILLLDEADVFLEQRSPHDLERNKLVSIFLRVLEYYQGILFLTTNRVQTFDAAFYSRIHVSIDYPELNAESRRKVWANFISVDDTRGQAQVGMTGSDLDELARFELNGRQIKNVVKTASLIAVRNGEPLGVAHVRTVIGVMGNVALGTVG